MSKRIPPLALFWPSAFSFENTSSTFFNMPSRRATRACATASSLLQPLCSSLRSTFDTRLHIQNQHECSVITSASRRAVRTYYDGGGKVFTNSCFDARHKSMIAYLSANNLPNTAAALRAELSLGEDVLDAATVKKYETLLEKKWSSVVRLQKKALLSFPLTTPAHI